MQGKSPPVQVQNPYRNLFAGFQPAKTGVYKVHLCRILNNDRDTVSSER